MNLLIIFAARWLVYVSLLSIPYLWVRHKRRDIARIVVTVIVAGIFWKVLSCLFPVARPFVAEGFVPLVNVSLGVYYASFPSGHTAFLAALGIAIAFSEKPLGILILILGVLVGISRVAVGVHYPSDILAGFILGIAVASLVKFAFSKVIVR